MASKLDPPTLSSVLQRYRRGIACAKAVKREMLGTLQEIIDSKVLGDQIDIKTLITEDEKCEIERVLEIKPTIAFMGQLNSGKSSLANEILGGGTWLPVAADACTSRIVRLKHTDKKAYKREIRPGQAESSRSMLPDNKPTMEDIKLTDREKSDPTLLDVELEFNVQNTVLNEKLEIIDLPGWNESSEINEVLKHAFERLLLPHVLIVYVLNAGKVVSGQDRELIPLLGNDKRIIYACNKVDYEADHLRRDHGDGEITGVRDNGTMVYTVNADGREILLQNKAQNTFDSFDEAALLWDPQIVEKDSLFCPVSARMMKEARTAPAGPSSPLQAYFNRKHEQFRTTLAEQLQEIIDQHLVECIRKISSVLTRFAEGTRSRSEALSSELKPYQVLEDAGKREREAYEMCMIFLIQEQASIGKAVSEAMKEEEGHIIHHAKELSIHSVDVKQDQLPAIALKDEIMHIAERMLKRKIAARVENLREKYVSKGQMLSGVVEASGVKITETPLFQIAFGIVPQDRQVHFLMAMQHGTQYEIDSENADEVGKAALGIFHLIPSSVGMALRDTIEKFQKPDVFSSVLRAALKVEAMDSVWKEKVARMFLSSINPKLVASAIVDISKKELAKLHLEYAQSHRTMMKLQAAKSQRSKEDQRRLRTKYNPQIYRMQLTMHSLRCLIEKGDPLPETARKIVLGTGKYSKVYTFTAPTWGRIATADRVIKVSAQLTEDTLRRVSRNIHDLRNLQTISGSEKHLVKLYDTLLTPFHSKKEGEQALVLVVERRKWTLPEAMKQGLTKEQGITIASGVAKALEFMHQNGAVIRNLRAEVVSIGAKFAAKIDLTKIEESLFEKSWLGVPAYHQPPEVYNDPDLLSPPADMYSFGILLWDLLSEGIHAPECYRGCQTKEDMSKAVREGVRPRIPEQYRDKILGRTMKDCWKEAKERPSLERLISCFTMESESSSSDKRGSSFLSCRPQ